MRLAPFQPWYGIRMQPHERTLLDAELVERSTTDAQFNTVTDYLYYPRLRDFIRHVWRYGLQSFTALCFRVSQLALLLGGTDRCYRAQEGFADHQDDSCARLNILSWPWDRSLYRASSPLQSSCLLQWPLLRSFGRKQWLRQTLNSSLVRFFARRTMDDGGRHGNVPPDSYSFDFERKMNDGAAT